MQDKIGMELLHGGSGSSPKQRSHLGNRGGEKSSKTFVKKLVLAELIRKIGQNDFHF